MNARAAASPEREYDRRSADYERLRVEVLFTLEAALQAEGLKTHSTTGRVKDRGSFIEKIQRKGYDNPLEQMDDIVGARVVVLFLSDLPRLQALIAQNFHVIEVVDSVEGGAAESFGYMSIHYVCRLRPEHSGPRYSGLSGLRFEIQCRTILMDAWANVSHYLAYKGEASVPQRLKRDFHALAGLFYVADQHFQLFFRESTIESSETLEAALHAGTESGTELPINRDTIKALLDATYPGREDTEPEDASELVEELVIAGYETVRQVAEDLALAHEAALQYEKDYPPRVADDGEEIFAPVGLARQALSIANDDYARVRYPSDKDLLRYRLRLKRARGANQ